MVASLMSRLYRVPGALASSRPGSQYTPPIAHPATRERGGDWAGRTLRFQPPGSAASATGVARSMVGRRVQAREAARGGKACPLRMEQTVPIYNGPLA